MGRKTAIFCLLAIACYVSCNQETNQSELSKKDHAGSNSVQSDGRNVSEQRISKTQHDVSNGTKLKPTRTIQERRFLNGSYLFNRTETTDFYELIVYDHLFVDKTLLIGEFMNAFVSVPIIKRPNGWGKTLNMDMLRRFFDIEVDHQGEVIGKNGSSAQSVNRVLFTGGEITLPDKNGGTRKKLLEPLKVSEQPDVMKHQGSYPVIVLNFDGVYGNSYEEIEDKVRKRIQKLFRERQYLLKNITDKMERTRFKMLTEGSADMTRLQRAVHFLSKLLFQYFDGKRVVVLMDNHDAPMNHFYLVLSKRYQNGSGQLYGLEEFQNLLNLFGGMLTHSLRRNEYLQKGLISGTTQTNLFCYSLIDEHLCNFYGFTEEEVNQLIARIPGGNSTVDRKAMKNWYYGYRFGNNQVFYSPVSVTKYLSNNATLDYYLLTEKRSKDTEIIDSVLLSNRFQPTLQKLVAGNNIYSVITDVDTFDSIDTGDRVLSSLLFFGYLSPSRRRGKQCELHTPNEEMKHYFEIKFELWLDKRLNMPRFNPIADLLLTGKIVEFHSELNRTVAERLNGTHTSGAEPERIYSAIVKSFLKSPDCDVWNIKFNGQVSRHVLMVAPVGDKYDKAAIISVKSTTHEEEIEAKLQSGLEETDIRKYREQLAQYKNVRLTIKMCLTFEQLQIYAKYKVE